MSFLTSLFKKKNTVSKREHEQVKTALADAYRTIDDLNAKIEAMKAEYVQLQGQTDSKLVQTAEDAVTRVYRTLAPLLIAYPKACAIVAERVDAKASDVIGMLRPLDSFIENFGLEQIGKPGEEVAFDPVLHNAEGVDEGARVIVKSVGYRRGETILDKAVVRGVI